MKSLIAALLFTAATSLLAQERFVTLTLPTGTAPGGTSIAFTNILTVAESEAAELVSIGGSSYTLNLAIERDGNVTYAGLRTDGVRAGPYPLIVAGPAKFTLWGFGGLATFKIHPNQFPPDRTMVIPAGPGGANVTLECSTNLTTWSPALNGAYTNLPSVKFFRIRMDRIDAPKGN